MEMKLIIPSSLKLSLVVLLLVLETSNSVRFLQRSSRGQDEQPVLFQQWGKYFRSVSLVDLNPGADFVINEKYKLEKMHPYKEGVDDSNVPYTIPEETDFFFFLTSEALYVMDSRDDSIQNMYDSLDISDLKPVGPRDLRDPKSGIVDLGTSTDGFCMKLQAKDGSLGEYFWQICFHDDASKELLLNQISLLREKDLSNYSEPDELETSVALTDQEIAALMREEDSPTGVFAGGNIKGKPVNGRWVVIQNWTECSLRCGGGTKYFQRLCIPPQDGGKPCFGESILTKPCNEQPCPTPNIESEEVEIMPAKMTIRHLSARKQRFEDCVIMEGDLEKEIRRPESSNGNSFRLPQRIVLNNSTLSSFRGDSVDAIDFSIPLTELTDIQQPDEDAERCFVVLSESRESITLCVMQGAQRPYGEIKQEWVDSIFHFKEDCQADRRYENSELDEEFSKRLHAVQIEIMDKSAESQEDKLLAAQEDVIAGHLKTALASGMEILQRELQVEMMAEKEEEKLEKQREQEAERKLEDEKRRRECVEKAIKHRARLENKEEEARQKILHIQEEIKQAVLTNRSLEEQRISEMKFRAEQKRKEREQEVEKIRRETTMAMFRAERQGDSSRCIEQGDDARASYCDHNFKESFHDYQYCLKNANTFCLACCDHEFGELHAIEQMNCRSLCEQHRVLEPSGSIKQNTGEWIWTAQKDKK